MSRIALLSLVCTLAAACTSATTTKPTTIAATSITAAPQEQAPEKPEVSVDPQATRDNLQRARRQNLARLRMYIDAGVFPKNQVQPGLLNVFQDDEGHLCAVANLINWDGHTKLIASTTSTDNYIVLAQVDQGPLLNWILNSGLTQEEIGMIQVPYMGEFSMGEDSAAPLLAQQEINDFREQEIKRLQDTLGVVHTQLVANTASSIEVALQRVVNPTKIATR